jgi:hypothetical protein
MGDHNHYVSFLKKKMKGKNSESDRLSNQITLQGHNAGALFPDSENLSLSRLSRIKTIRPRYCHVSNPQKFDPPVVQLALKIKLLAS